MIWETITGRLRKHPARSLDSQQRNRRQWVFQGAPIPNIKILFIFSASSTI